MSKSLINARLGQLWQNKMSKYFYMVISDEFASNLKNDIVLIHTLSFDGMHPNSIYWLREYCDLIIDGAS